MFDKIIMSKYCISCLLFLESCWQCRASIWGWFSAGTSQTKTNTGVVCQRVSVNISDVTDTDCNKQDRRTMIGDFPPADRGQPKGSGEFPARVGLWFSVLLTAVSPHGS